MRGERVRGSTGRRRVFEGMENRTKNVEAAELNEATATHTHTHMHTVPTHTLMYYKQCHAHLTCTRSCFPSTDRQTWTDRNALSHR